jgi:hypothetical protein
MAMTQTTDLPALLLQFRHCPTAGGWSGRLSRMSLLDVHRFDSISDLTSPDRPPLAQIGVALSRHRFQCPIMSPDFQNTQPDPTNGQRRGIQVQLSLNLSRRREDLVR